jgi:hypothetical protein
MARSAKVALVSVCLCAAVAAGASCSAEPAATSPTTQPSTTAAALTPTPASTSTVFEGDLRSLLLRRPSGARATEGPSSPSDGLIDIDNAAVAMKVEPARIRDAGFVRGAMAEWIESDRTWVGIFLYQFNGPGSARVWARSLRGSFESNDVFRAGVPIPGVPDGMVYARKRISSNGRWLAEAVYSKNTISVELFVTGPMRHDPQKTIDLAIAQYARLP